MMEPTDAFKRLPKWAQTEIENLRSDALALQGAAAAAIGHVHTRIQVNPYADLMGREHKCFIPDRETVRFQFGRNYIDVHFEGEALSVMSDMQIQVHPRDANVIWVTPIDD